MHGAPHLTERVARPEWLGLVALLTEVEAIDPRAHTRTTPDRLESEVREPLVSRVSPLATLLASLEDAVAITEPDTAALCFVARAEVRATAKEAERARGRATEILVACDILRTRMLQAIDAVLATKDGLPPDRFDRADGRAAASARSLYARLREVVSSASKAGGVDAAAALASVAATIHALTTHPDYAHVRLGDRFVVESLYRRILEWGRPDVPFEDGARLLLDAEAMSGLLEAINRRPTLRRHDFDTLEAALVALARDESAAVILELVGWLRGRDPVLDALAGKIRATPRNPVLKRLLVQRLSELRVELAPAADGAGITFPF